MYILDLVLPLCLLEMVIHQSIKFPWEKLRGGLRGCTSVPLILSTYRGFLEAEPLFKDYNPVLPSLSTTDNLSYNFLPLSPNFTRMLSIEEL